MFKAEIDFSRNNLKEVAPGMFTYLSPAQLKELRRCLAIAYPNNKAKQKREYVTLALQPNAAKRFCDHPLLNRG